MVEKALAIGVLGNCADILPKLIKDGFKPDVVTDQTSAHDELNGYVPSGFYGDNLKEAFVLRKNKPRDYIKKAMQSMKVHCKALLDLSKMVLLFLTMEIIYVGRHLSRFEECF